LLNLDCLRGAHSPYQAIAACYTFTFVLQKNKLMQQVFNSIPHSYKELKAVIEVKKHSSSTSEKQSLDALAYQMADIEFCYAALNKVSRSFAVVIQQLPPELRNSVCIFYLTLRGLDTIEDDMNVQLDKKINLLLNFYKNCGNEQLRLENMGDSEHYRHLLQHYYKVARAFNALDGKYQQVITDITRKMGEGMAHFAQNDLKTKNDYDLYCHYVAGLVGYGLSGLFSASGYEDYRLKQQFEISNAMGLMLQKTNIVRDYNEDMLQGRIFWHEEVWKKYAENFEWFAQNSKSHLALSCLNEMVCDSLQHLPECIAYLQLLKNPSVFRFCAIPQVMAVATMAEVYNNPLVFTSVVKIRKPLAAEMMVYTNTLQDAEAFMIKALEKIENKTAANTPFAKEILNAVAIAKAAIRNPVVYKWKEVQEPTLEQAVFF
jgi:farnesyl-diphosphate farnesyltransferase